MRGLGEGKDEIMLKTVWLTNKKKGGVAMLLGGFDGLHLGHRQLLSRAKKSGLPVGAMTIIDGKEGSLFTTAEREDIFRRAGVDFLFELPFREIINKSSSEFLQLLEDKFQPKLYVCGEDFRFGTGASGTPKMIKERGQVCVECMPLLEMYGEKVSSRTVKKLLTEGNIPNANVLLGEEFFLIGEVKKDRQIGRTIGFPTANIFYPQEKFPLKEGVYETVTLVDGKEYRGITNYGARPTFCNDVVCTETYLDGFEGDLYGRTLRVRFVRYLREITKFDSAQALSAQLQADIRRVRTND